MLSVMLMVTITATGMSLRADAPKAEFFRGINLNGPPVCIDGHQWEGGDSKDLVSRDQAFENQAVPLIPPTDPDRALMIRSSRWNGQVDINLKNVPSGTYMAFLYVWEDNNSETFRIELNGQVVLQEFVSGSAGTWKKLGPWRVAVNSGSIRLTTQGGAANLSGLEIWKGEGALLDSTAAKPPTNPRAAQAFDSEVAPILAKHCLECHGRSMRKGKLALMTETSALEGGVSGPVIVRGKPEESLLWEFVDSDAMPKDRPPLSGDEKQRLRRWIADGAAWGTTEVDPYLATTDRRAGYDWWSLQPMTKPLPPMVHNASWPLNPIDRFILATLEAKNLNPAPRADRRTLIRRLSFDLTGLPPEPQDVSRFVEDTDEGAYEKLIDRLLSSPRYGERWARHWLDVVRFGESEGFERNHIRENAWRYRDWVIQAFNRNLAFDDFVKLQIAGDILYPGNLDALIATGYHVCGTWDEVAHYEGSTEMQKATRFDEMEDLVSTLGQAYLGLTIACARCHDHKFDPISQTEYYQFASLLAGVNQEKEERKVEIANTTDQPGFSGSIHAIVPRQPPLQTLLERGDYRKPREVVSPFGLKALKAPSPDFGLEPDAPEGVRRQALAHWLTNTQNPLTSRVFVNRLWHYHFGQGLVETPSDFGFNGGRPSHPELLDYLASLFVMDGWNIKQLHRLIVTSATYQQASQVSNEPGERSDAENRLLWRANPKRLEGEAIRDATLAVSGELNYQMGGPSFIDVRLNKQGANGNHEFTDPTGEFSDAVNRRTIYRLWGRSGNHPLLETLDCPDPSVMTPKRMRTITPVQALSLSNNVYMEKCAERFAERVRREAGDNLLNQIERTWHLAFARSPNQSEIELAQSFVVLHGLDQLCLVLFNSNEFLFVD
jgi:cytochrome c553